MEFFNFSFVIATLIFLQLSKLPLINCGKSPAAKIAAKNRPTSSPLISVESDPAVQNFPVSPDELDTKGFLRGTGGGDKTYENPGENGSFEIKQKFLPVVVGNIAKTISERTKTPELRASSAQRPQIGALTFSNESSNNTSQTNQELPQPSAKRLRTNKSVVTQTESVESNKQRALPVQPKPKSKGDKTKQPKTKESNNLRALPGQPKPKSKEDNKTKQTKIKESNNLRALPAQPKPKSKEDNKTKQTKTKESNKLRALPAQPKAKSKEDNMPITESESYAIGGSEEME